MGRTESLPFTPYASKYWAIFAVMAKLGRQLSSALGTTASQDLAAVGSSHSLSEAMNFGSVTLFGLIGTNSCHIDTPPVKICSTAALQPQRVCWSKTKWRGHADNIIAEKAPKCQLNFSISETCVFSVNRPQYIDKTPGKKYCNLLFSMVEYIFGKLTE